MGEVTRRRVELQTSVEESLLHRSMNWVIRKEWQYIPMSTRYHFLKGTLDVLTPENVTDFYINKYNNPCIYGWMKMRGEEKLLYIGSTINPIFTKRRDDRVKSHLDHSKRHALNLCICNQLFINALKWGTLSEWVCFPIIMFDRGVEIDEVRRLEHNLITIVKPNCNMRSVKGLHVKMRKSNSYSLL